MSTFKIVEPEIGAPSPVSATATVQGWPLGYLARAADQQTGSANFGAGQFIYCQGSNVASVGQFVQIQNNSAVLLTNNISQKFPVGVAAGVLSATNVYGWVQVQGLCDYARGTNSSIAAGVALYGGSVNGYVNSASVDGGFVLGLVAPVSYTSSQSQSLTVQLNFPVVHGSSAAV
jgi:cell shape-determining protein MreC